MVLPVGYHHQLHHHRCHRHHPLVQLSQRLLRSEVHSDSGKLHRFTVRIVQEDSVEGPTALVWARHHVLGGNGHRIHEELIGAGVRWRDGRTKRIETVSEFELKSEVLLDEVRAGGRINLIIGRGLTGRAREALGLGESELFRKPETPEDTGKGFTLGQKMVGRACGVDGIRPGTYCEPKMTTVGSQDTTGPMTRDELKDLACLGFSADLTMQSFCHTAAYPLSSCLSPFSLLFFVFS